MNDRSRQAKADVLTSLIEDLSFVQKESSQSIFHLGEYMSQVRSDTHTLHQLLKDIADKLDNGQGNSAGLYAKLDRAHQVAVEAEETVVSGTKEQKKLAEEARKLAMHIAEGASKTQQVSRSMAILSMNANIEAYRLGMQGRAINVITNEFKSVSNETSKLNDMINTTAQKIGEILPRMDTTSTLIHDNASSGIKEIIESLDAAVVKFGEILDGVRTNTAITAKNASAIESALGHSIVSLQHADRTSQVIERVKATLVDLLADVDGARAENYRKTLGVVTTSSALTNQDPDALESGEINFL